MSDEVLKFVPLGGLGEIGMNCFALEWEGSILVVDCGATFPDDDLGEDLIIPDFRYLQDNEERIVGVFVTHGHEDHIGAIVHFLERLGRDCPVFAPAHAAALIASRLAEADWDDDCLRVVEAGQRYELGPFRVEPIRVAHSIIQATSLFIEAGEFRMIHTADFDLDREQPAGWLTDEKRFRELGDQGIDLLLSDSTNIESSTREYTEGDVGRALGRLVRAAPGRVVVGMFSSNAHRMVALAEAARSAGRRLCLLGRSLRRQYEIAVRLGALVVPSDLLVAPEQVGQLPPEAVLVIAGGSQGEAPSALRRLAAGTHPQLRLEEGDWCLMSARVIPGNEKAVFRMANDFLRQGVVVHSRKGHPDIHTSGHASREELARMLSWVRPRSFIPVHGTLHHLRLHEALAQEVGVSETLVVENGAVVVLDRDRRLRVSGHVAAGLTRIAYGGEELDAATRRRRFQLARAGSLFVSLAVDEHLRPLGRVLVTSLGVPSIDRDESALRVIEAAAKKALNDARETRMSTLQTVVLRAVKADIFEMTGVRPRVEVHLHRVQ